MELFSQPVELQVETLESEIKAFVDTLPYWLKFLYEKILSDSSISEIDIESAHSYLLEELQLKEGIEKKEITISYNVSNQGDYKSDLLFTRLSKVEGVNALSENQTIEFGPNLTIIYGTNGSGKSGYIRLLKKTFYSKSQEEIVSNVHTVGEPKPVTAEFTFQSANSEINLRFPEHLANVIFQQFAVFDGKSVLKHLENRNEFEFRPAGLSFFSSFTDAINRVEAKHNLEISKKQSTNQYSEIFEGESDIKTFIQSITTSSKIEDLKKHTPFSEKDKEEKKKVEKEYDELRLTSKNKEKEIQNLEKVKQLLASTKQSVEKLNQYFTKSSLDKVRLGIEDSIKKEEFAKKEGIENFKTDKVKNVGSSEWKLFLEAAENFAKKQVLQNVSYPIDGDNCILCHQTLSADAQKLIINYWNFIKSSAEQEFKDAKANIDKIKAAFEKLNFDLFPNENTLTTWLTENSNESLTAWEKDIINTKKLSDLIISDLVSKTPNQRTEVKVSLSAFESISKAIESKVEILKNDKQHVEVLKLGKSLTYLIHKEKLELHIAKIETHLDNLKWLGKASNVNWISLKRTTTETEKRLSGKYFNQKYIDSFNQECADLKGNFGIAINHTGTLGTSYRQLFIKGKNPSAILSEGEQKVIALADFLVEMQLSDVNKGVIFDDPVTSLDEERKSLIAERLVKEATSKQMIIFTHDLVFVSSLVAISEEQKINMDCHWIEKLDEKPGVVWLKNAPSFEKSYKKSGKAQDYYNEAKQCGPQQREDKIKNGFAALRTSYETLVVFDLFKGVVQRFNERISIDSLPNVNFTSELRDEIVDNFRLCCRYMEGHSHSDKYAYIKPTLENLSEEINRFNEVKKKIADLKGT